MQNKIVSTAKGLFWSLAALFIAVAFLIQSTKDTSVQAARKQADAARAEVAQLRKNTIAGCERGNLLRKENNRRAAELGELRGILVGFATEASIARAASGQVQIAQQYHAYADRAAALKFHTIPLIDCSKAF